MGSCVYYLIQKPEAVPDHEPDSTQSANSFETVKTLTGLTRNFGKEPLGANQTEKRTEREEGYK